MRTTSPLTPTYYGHIASTHDALILFEACLNGTLNHVARRPHDRERVGLIKSGNVFIYEEHSSGIKRWTDGVPWSPSRILGNFLIYRELEHAFPPGEKKRAMKRDKRPPAVGKATHPYGRYTTNGRPVVSSLENHRHLVGSLTDSYEFKSDGLVKKTISVTIGSVSHHLVSYYAVDDVLNGQFNNPSKEARFQHVVPRMELTSKQSFRTPLDEVEPMDQMDCYEFGRSRYELASQNMVQRPVPIAQPLSFAQNYPTTQGMYGEGFNLPTVATPNPLAMQSPVGGGYAGFTSSPINYAARPDAFDTATTRPRYDAMGVADLSLMGTNQLRRPSTYESAGSMDSAASATSLKSEATDSGYSTQSYYTSTSRDSQTSTPQYMPQRALPSLPMGDNRPMQYSRAVPSTYSVTMENLARESMWQMGNAATGHGHYAPGVQQWASAGPS